MTIRLRDGARVLIRPVEPDDRATLAEGFERLSAESRYRRFFAPVSQLRERDLDYLTRVDHHDHEALLAVEPRSGRGVGVARYVRTSRAGRSSPRARCSRRSGGATARPVPPR